MKAVVSQNGRIMKQYLAQAESMSST
jgi:hypothetical protein